MTRESTRQPTGPAPIQARYPVTVFFDGSCQLCSGEIRNMQVRDTAQRLVFVDCSPPDFEGGPAPRAALIDAIHATDADGQLFVGIATFRVCYAAVGLPAVSRMLGWPLVAPLAARGYPLLVRNRHRLPQWLVRTVFERAAASAARRAVQRANACAAGQCARPS